MLKRLHFCILCVSFVAMSLAAEPTAESERIDFYYGLAEGNYLVGDLNGATIGIEQVLRVNDSYVPAWTLLARVELDKGNGLKALEAAEQAISSEVNVQEHRLLKALVLGHLNRRQEASGVIQSVIQNTPQNSQDAKVAHQLLGLLRMADGDWDAAAKSFNDIYLSDPTNANVSFELQTEAYLEKARSKLATGENMEAVAALDQAISVFRGQSGKKNLTQRTALRMARARLLSEIGEAEKAIPDLQSLTAEQPENFEALITLASLYASVERWSSLDHLIPSIAARPEFQDIALYLEGRVALSRKRAGTARAKFEAAIEALPSEASQLRNTLFFYRGYCLDLLERTDDANESIIHAIDAGFKPETSKEALFASQIMLRTKHPEKAIPLLEAVTLNRITQDAEVWAMLGRAHLANSSPTLALSAFNESIRINPQQANTRALRASQLRKIGDLEGALADYQAAHNLQPENASLVYAIGLIHLQMGQLIQAEQSIGLASKQLTDNAGLQLLHALLAHTIGAPKAARQSLDLYFKRTSDKYNYSAHYLNYILLHQENPTLKLNLANQDPIFLYFAGKQSRKSIIDQAGIAESPEIAQQQICESAFWMAQFEIVNGEETEAVELLKIVTQMNSPDQSEYQFAKWQLKKLESASPKKDASTD